MMMVRCVVAEATEVAGAGNVGGLVRSEIGLKRWWSAAVTSG